MALLGLHDVTRAVVLTTNSALSTFLFSGFPLYYRMLLHHVWKVKYMV
jgi:hypothetical protein